MPPIFITATSADLPMYFLGAWRRMSARRFESLLSGRCLVSTALLWPMTGDIMLSTVALYGASMFLTTESSGLSYSEVIGNLPPSIATTL